MHGRVFVIFRVRQRFGDLDSIQKLHLFSNHASNMRVCILILSVFLAYFLFNQKVIFEKRYK